MIVVHAGHCIDKGDEPEARFPACRVGSVYRRSYLHLLERMPRTVFSGGTSGADLLFLRAAEDLLIPFNVVLPMPVDEFREQAVFDQAVGDQRLDWVESFNRAIARAATVPTHNLSALEDWCRRGHDLILDAAQSECTSDDKVEALAVLSARSVSAESLPADTSAIADFVTKAGRRSSPIHTIDPLLDWSSDRSGTIRVESG